MDSRISRRGFIGASAAAAAALGCAARPEKQAEKPASGQGDASALPPFELEEKGLAELAAGLKSGQYTATSLTRLYLERIEALDRSGPRLNSVIEVNPEAVAIADSLDRELKEKGPRGPLHGIPVLIKDNIASADCMQTTAGSLALLGSRPPADSQVVRLLRQAGAVILGKTNLSEWANFRSSGSTSGWSGRGGLTRNPYALDRNPSGSSSGSAVAVSANLCAAAIGTETDGSIVGPSAVCGCVGLKPTVGLVGRSGIIPISASQDNAGPMTRTVADTAVLLGALAGVDPDDPRTAQSQGHIQTDYTSFLDPAGLKGARIGVLRNYFGYHPGVDRALEGLLRLMKEQGAELLDPLKIPTEGQFHGAEYKVLTWEFKDGLNRYLDWVQGGQVHSLKELIAFNEANSARELPYFGQETLIESESRGPLTDKEYLEARERCRNLAGKQGIDKLMDEHKLDALFAPSGGPAHVSDLVCGDHGLGGSSGIPAMAGYPNLNLPGGEVFGLPFGVSFFGRAWSEPVLLRIGYAFEQAARLRKVPRFLPSADLRI